MSLELKPERPKPGEGVILKVEFRTQSQGTLQVALSLKDLQVEGGHPVERMVRSGPPEFIENPSRAWPVPQGPMVFSGDVKPGYEHMARKVLGLR